MGICGSNFVYGLRNDNPDHSYVRQFTSHIGSAAGCFLFSLEDPIVIVQRSYLSPQTCMHRVQEL